MKGKKLQLIVQQTHTDLHLSVQNHKIFVAMKKNIDVIEGVTKKDHLFVWCLLFKSYLSHKELFHHNTTKSCLYNLLLHLILYM